jgi:hypothetical protein
VRTKEPVLFFLPFPDGRALAASCIHGILEALKKDRKPRKYKLELQLREMSDSESLPVAVPPLGPPPQAARARRRSTTVTDSDPSHLTSYVVILLYRYDMQVSHGHKGTPY